MRTIAKSPLFLLGLLAVLFAALGPDVAFAAGGGEGHHEPHVANWWGLGKEYQDAPALGWVTLTWLIFVGLLYRFVKRPLKEYLEARSDGVRRALEEAQSARAEAEARAAEAEERLRRLDDEIAALKDEFRRRGEAEAQRLEALGKQTAERIAKDTEETIAAEYERAETALKAEAARLALEIAEERIRGAISPDDHKRLHKGFVQDVSA